MANVNTLTAKMFGGVKFFRGRKLLDGFATQKVLGLLCYLIDQAPDDVSREKLMIMFWGESPENQARYNLRYALWNIRKVYRVGSETTDLLDSSRSTCRINPDIEVSVDSMDFLRLIRSAQGEEEIPTLEKAVSLYQGPFLDGFTLKNLPEWEEWLYHRRETLHEAYLDAALRLGNLYLDLGQTRQAVQAFKRLLFNSPDMEPAHEGLIRAYADQGRSAAALRQFTTYATRVKRELGATPSESLTELARQLRNNTYERAPQAAAHRSVVIPGDPAGSTLADTVQAKKTEAEEQPKAPAETPPSSVDTSPSEESPARAREDETPDETSSSAIADVDDLDDGWEGDDEDDAADAPAETAAGVDSSALDSDGDGDADSEPMKGGRRRFGSLPSSEFLPLNAFVGRNRELSDLKSVVEDVRQGNGQVVIVSGEMGIGKTRLTQELIDSALPDFLVGAAEVPEIQSPATFEGLIQVLEAFNEDLRLPAGKRKQLAELFNLRARIKQDAEEAAELKLLDSIRHWLVELAGEMPVLIAIDDLHWASETLLNVFAALIQEAKRLPLLIIGIFRTFEEQTEDRIASSLISLARTGRLRRISLRALPDDEARELILSQAGDVADRISSEELENLVRYTCGIPLFAVELANFIKEGNLDFASSPLLMDQPDFSSSSAQSMVPPLMTKIANLRLNQFSDLHVQILKATSLILNQFSLELIKALFDADEEAIEDALVDLEHKNVMHHTESASDIVFSYNHQMIKLAIRETVETLERRRYHKKILRAADEAGEELGTEEMAYYLYHGGDQVGAIPYLLASSKLWFGYGDSAAGLRYSRAAIAIAMDKLTSQPEQMIEAVLEHGENLIQHGQVKAAVDVYTEAVRRLEQTGGQTGKQNLVSKRREVMQMLDSSSKVKQHAPVALASSKRALASVKLSMGDREGAEAMLDDAEALVDKLPDSDMAFRETGMLFTVRARMMLDDKPEDAVMLLGNALEMLSKHGTPSELAEAARELARAHRRVGRLEQAEEALEKARELAESELEPSATASYYHEHGLIAEAKEQFDEAEHDFEEALTIARGNTSLATTLPSIVRDYAELLDLSGKGDRAKELRNEFKSATDSDEQA